MLAERTFRLVIAVAAATALSACGETTRIEPSAHATARNVGSVAPTVFPAPTKSAAPSPTETAAPTATSSPKGGGGGNTVTATATNKFDPQKLTVKVGTEVTWTAQGFHTVTSGEPGKKDASGPMQGAGGFVTYKVTFDKAGTYPYYCEPHATLGMVGEIVVT